MAEFKAQILGILLVIGVFAILCGLYQELIRDTVREVSTQVSEVLNEQ